MDVGEKGTVMNINENVSRRGFVDVVVGGLASIALAGCSGNKKKGGADSENTPGIELTINDAYLSDDTYSDDKTNLVLNLSACNVSKETQYVRFALIGIEAYQGGKSLELHFINETDYYTGDIKPGTTVEGCIAFTLLDDATDVEVETADGSLTNPQTFNLSSLETVGK